MPFDSPFVGADDSVRPFCTHSLRFRRGRCPHRPAVPLSFRASDRVTGVGIRLPQKRKTDCRVAVLLAMTARRCRADGTSGRRPLRAVQRTCPAVTPVIPSQCAHWRGNSFPARHRRAAGTSGRRPLRAVQRTCPAVTPVIPSQCAHWRGNSFPARHRRAAGTSGRRSLQS